jgi:hypothetical protein
LTPAATAEIAGGAFGGTQTFRRGTIGAWHERFTPEHTRACKRLIGDLLVDLGYEADQNW